MPDIPLKDEEKQKLEVVSSLLQRNLTNGQAAKKLGLSIRQIQRLKLEVKKHGHLALIHKLKGKPSNHKLSQDNKMKAISLVKEKYVDFHPTLASEKLEEYHSLYIKPETLRLWMIEEGLWKARKQKRPDYHSWRERREYFGELQQFDGSYHFWFEERLLDEEGFPQETCLLASIDDATGKITHAKFDLNESVVAVFNFWLEYVKTLGKPAGIYLDKFSTYKINHKNATDNFELITQFQKAMRALGIEVINANSPEAKGRVERLFGTLQDRLVKELRLANINSITEANLFLRRNFIPKFNLKFSVLAAKDGDVHRALSWKEKLNLRSIFSIKHTRRVNLDYTIQFKNHFYQLEQIQPITIRPKEKILIEERLSGTIHLKHKGKYLNYFILPSKPRKITEQPAIITSHPLNWKPPPNHPWRRYKQKLTLKG